MGLGPYELPIVDCKVEFNTHGLYETWWSCGSISAYTVGGPYGNSVPKSVPKKYQILCAYCGTPCKDEKRCKCTECGAPLVDQ